MPTPWRRFRIRHKIGSGGFGDVYLAEVASAGGFARVVALKLLHADFHDQAEIVGRLRDEARLLGQLQHPAIVRAEDLIFLDGRLAVVMEFIPGANLLDLINPRTNPDDIPPRIPLQVVRRVCEALEAAWSRPSTLSGQPLRVMHRDIKPSNIRVTPDGEVKVLDFGVARADAMDREIVTENELIGSTPYIAPEVFLNGPLGPYTDLYSLGVTFYEMIARRRFGRCGLNPKQQAQKLEERMAEADFSSFGGQEGPLRLLLRDMLAFDFGDRPQALEVAESCRRIAAQLPEPSLQRWTPGKVEEVAARTRLPATGSLDGQVLEEESTRSGLRDDATTANLHRDTPSQASTTTIRARGSGCLLLGLPLALLAGCLLLLVGVAMYTGFFPWPGEELATSPPVSESLQQAAPAEQPASPDKQGGAAQGATSQAEPATTQAAKSVASPAPAKPSTSSPSSEAVRKESAEPSAAQGAAPRGQAPSAQPQPTQPESTEPAATPAPAEHAPAASSVPLEVAFTSRPLGLAVSVDGVYRGATPLRVTLGSGPHRVVFESGVQTLSKDIVVEEGGKDLWFYDHAEGEIR